MSLKETKEIFDLSLSSFLSVMGHKLIATPKVQSGRKSFFVFESSEELEKDILTFYNRQARVDPLSFIETYRNLKALTY